MFRKTGVRHQQCSDLRPSLPLGAIFHWLTREEIALLKVQGHSIREIGRRWGRAASTISREMRRNAATRGGGLDYRATTAQWHADRSARRPKPTKLAPNAALRAYVEERLTGAVVAPSGAYTADPTVRWSGRRHRPAKGSTMGQSMEP
nr:hypothetical protein BDOA9_0202960 [Bradyrhizobium sp. DOA9]